MEEEKPVDELEDIPFACSICRKYFLNPVKTRQCKHYFCEKCALKFAKCQICGATTNGIYAALTKEERSKIERSIQRHKENNPEYEMETNQE